MAGVWTLFSSVPRFSTYIPRHLKNGRKALLLQQAVRCISSFKASDLEIEFCSPDQLKPKPPVSELVFGKNFTDYMLKIEWDGNHGWGKPRIVPFQNLTLHPAAKVLHYATELFEGMKAYRGVDGEIRLFRPDRNMARMNRTAERSALPTFDGEELIELIKRQVQLEQEWVPHSESSSLYIRPTMIGTEEILRVDKSNKALLFIILCPVGPYYPTGFKPVSLLADPAHVRAWPGGCGAMKMGSNYGPTLAIQKLAESKGLQQVLWLFGDDHKISEVGAMNLMVYIDKGDGGRELITPPLDGIILPGVTRQSLLELARSWGEFDVTEREMTMGELLQLESEGRLLEIFGSGTACVVCPVAEIHYGNHVLKIPTMEHENPLNQRFFRALTDIQYGRVPHEWAIPIE
ncbi:branched chain amino acid transaminase isoform X2 [Oratosquilla oratoria]|uniref:branched chain amino acid transaminase isoform X2 n=1 Tax=Oratosquilla oratoria TaxID=337810 RepID=UPI003F767C8D